jgi:hypothetical protein
VIPAGALRKRCSCCHVLILVPATSPCSSRLFLNGYWVTSMDQDSQLHNRGFLCEHCLDRLVFEKGKLSFGGFGREEERFENCEAIIGNNETWSSILDLTKEESL